jgi:transposase
MADIRLAARDRAALEQKARRSSDAREAGRALALLALADGEPAAAVARRLRVGRSTLDEWAARWADGARADADGADGARALGVELRFLPAACPELSPVEGLWRHVKGRVLAKEPTPDLLASLERACDELLMMSGTKRLRLAGVLSGNFWLPT